MLPHEEWKSVIKHGDSCTKGLVWVGENILTLQLTGEGTKLQQYNYYRFAVNSQAKVAHKPNKLCMCMHADVRDLCGSLEGQPGD